MPEKEYPLLTDDYVAGLLSQEANDCSTKYSALGLDAYKSSKRPTNQPKPNTRFLNNIIRDTNSHNRALLAKESIESQARLRELERAEREKQKEQERLQRRSRPGPADTRKRILGDIAAFIGPDAGRSKKSRRDDDGKRETESKSKRRDERERSPRRSRGESSTSKHYKNHDLFEESSDPLASSGRLKSDKHGDEDERGSRRRKYRDRSEDVTDQHHKSSSRRDRDRDSQKLPDRHNRSSTHEGERDRHHRKRPRSRSSNGHKRITKASSSKQPAAEDDNMDTQSDSDPLEDLIGPAPPQKDEPIRARGRGAHARSSGIDDRFAADYDPTMDIGPQPVSDEGDWEGTVEAYRDRQKWRQQGADRLRTAGYTEDMIKRWETGDKKDETDVRWTKQGAVREWDRGKVVDTDGDIGLQAEWGRLKGT